MLPSTLGAGIAFGQCELANLLALDRAAYDGFGGSVAISGNVALIGSPGDDDLGNQSGSAYVYRFDGTSWEQEAKLLASDGGPDDRFGHSVGLDNGVAIVGTMNANAAYVFRYDGLTWVEEAKLVPWDAYGFNFFGFSVAVHSDRAIAGAYADSEICGFCGAAYIFLYDGSKWIPEAKVHASDAQSGEPFLWDVFGHSVAIRDDVALVGKPRTSFPSPWGPGAAYVFRHRGEGWSEEAILVPSASGVGDRVGFSVALGDDLAVTGAPCTVGDCDATGSAYVFRALPIKGSDTMIWVQEATLDDPNGSLSDLFGLSVAIDRETAVVGAPYANGDGSDSGSAVVFADAGGSWFYQATLLPSDGAQGDVFGSSVAAGAGLSLIGAPGDDDNGIPSGSATLFGVDDNACLISGDIDGDGSVDVLDFLILLASWGTCPSPPANCSADLDGDATVGITDFLILLAHWS